MDKVIKVLAILIFILGLFSASAYALTDKPMGSIAEKNAEAQRIMSDIDATDQMLAAYQTQLNSGSGNVTGADKAKIASGLSTASDAIPVWVNKLKSLETDYSGLESEYKQTQSLPSSKGGADLQGGILDFRESLNTAWQKLDSVKIRVAYLQGTTGQGLDV